MIFKPEQLRCLPEPGLYTGAPISRDVLVSCAHAYMGIGEVVRFDGVGYTVVNRIKVGKVDLNAYKLNRKLDPGILIPAIRKPVGTDLAYGVNRNGEWLEFRFGLDGTAPLISTLRRMLKPRETYHTCSWVPLKKKRFTMYDSGSRVIAKDQNGEMCFIATATGIGYGPFLPYWFDQIRDAAEKLGGELPRR